MTKFIKLLKKYEITALCDIRRIPYSSHAPQYIKTNLELELNHHGIKYLYIGDKLGGFQKPVKNDLLKGIEQVKKHAQINQTVIMCSERDPSKCHRSFLLSPLMLSRNISVHHILPEGQLICHKELEEILLNRYFPDEKQISLFDTNKNRQELLKKAYQKRLKEGNSLNY